MQKNNNFWAQIKKPKCQLQRFCPEPFNYCSLSVFHSTFWKSDSFPLCHIFPLCLRVSLCWRPCSTFQSLDLYFLSNSFLGIKILANLNPLRRLLFFLVWFLSIVNTLNRDNSTTMSSLDLVMSISSPSLTCGQNKTWWQQWLSKIFIAFMHNVQALDNAMINYSCKTFICKGMTKATFPPFD